MLAFYMKKIQNEEMKIENVPALWRSKVQAALGA